MPLQDYINLSKKQFDKNDTLWFFWRSSCSTFHLIFILKMQKTHGQFAIRALVGQAASVTTKLETVIGLSIKWADFKEIKLFWFFWPFQTVDVFKRSTFYFSEITLCKKSLHCKYIKRKSFHHKLYFWHHLFIQNTVVLTIKQSKLFIKYIRSSGSKGLIITLKKVVFLEVNIFSVYSPHQLDFIIFVDLTLNTWNYHFWFKNLWGKCFKLHN